jgi:hypothetical protein
VPSDKLPEEFAPTGPKLSRFRIWPAPPIRPHLFADEARFTLRLALLAGGGELAAWVWFGRALAHRGLLYAILSFGLLRAARPFWAWLGTGLPRTAVAFLLLATSLIAQGFAATSFSDGLALAAAALPALGDLCVTCVADAITVERRAAAFSWLDMGQGLGCAMGLAVGVAEPRLATVVAAAALLIASLGIPDLKDRGTPRSAWPLAAQLSVLRSAVGQLVLLALAIGGLGAAAAIRPAWGWASAIPALAGMAVAARVDPFLRNAAFLPRALAIVAAAALALRWFKPSAGAALGLFALGAACAALPASVARGAGEMERPIASSLAWSALALGAAFGLAWATAAW